jgi:hypothetical protein
MSLISTHTVYKLAMSHKPVTNTLTCVASLKLMEDKLTKTQS